MFSSLKWFWHPFAIVEFCTFHFGFSDIAKIGGIIAAPFTGGASLGITAAAIQHDTAKDSAEDARKANEAAAAAAEKIAADNRATAEAQAKLATMQSASALPFTQAFSSSPMTGSALSVGGMSSWLLIGIAAAFFLFFLRR